MLGNIGPGMLILIIIAALLLFGPSKLPELGRAFGRTLREFKNGAKDIMSDDEQQQNQQQTQQAQRKELNPDANAELPQPEAPKSGSGDNRRLPD